MEDPDEATVKTEDLVQVEDPVSVTILHAVQT